MSRLGKELDNHIDEIVQLWFERWRDSEHPHPEISETALKNHLPVQLRVIAEGLNQVPAKTEAPKAMWRIEERLDPEARVSQDIPIEEVVHEYRLLVAVVRSWIDERSIDISFHEYSYFFESIFELTAESVRRYAKYQADQISKDRAEYLASLSHQMRSPLSVITSQLEVLELSEGALDSEAKERLQRNVNRLMFLVNGVMRLERFKGEELPVHLEKVYPAELIDSIVRDHEFDARSKGLRLDVSVNRTLRMKIDPDLFVDAFGNLLQNAIKYTDSGYVKVDTLEEDDEVTFRVQDSGPGISPARQKELFAPTRPKASGGVGIGLTIVHRALAAQGGRVGVESEVGRGSLFCMTLPREVRAGKAP